MKWIIVFFLSVVALVPVVNKQVQNPASSLSTTSKPSGLNQDFKMLKDVGEPYMDHFGLTDEDFKTIKDAGVTTIEGNFDICATDEDVEYFLNKSQEFGLQVILNAGAGEAEWGYECGANSYPRGQAPVWMAELVKKWVNKWKNHPSLYAWDTSNEAGSVFPNASWYNDNTQGVPDMYYLKPEQLKQAYLDVKTADPNHPIMIRMNGWFFYDNADNFFRPGNPFGKGIADIVMVNAYSNVKDYYNDFVKTVMSRAISSLKSIDPDVQFIVSIGAWSEPPLWALPTVEHLDNDLAQINSIAVPVKISYFKYGARGSKWYLPTSAPEIWNYIKTH